MIIIRLWIDNKEEQQRKWKKQIKGTVFQIYRKYLKEPLAKAPKR